MCYFNPSSAGQVSIEVKFFFQLQGLISGVSSPSPFPFWSPYVVWKRKVHDLDSQQRLGAFVSYCSYEPPGPLFSALLGFVSGLDKCSTSFPLQPLSEKAWGRGALVVVGSFRSDFAFDFPQKEKTTLSSSA